MLQLIAGAVVDEEEEEEEEVRSSREVGITTLLKEGGSAAPEGGLWLMTSLQHAPSWCLPHLAPCHDFSRREVISATV